MPEMRIGGVGTLKDFTEIVGASLTVMPAVEVPQFCIDISIPRGSFNGRNKCTKKESTQISVIYRHLSLYNSNIFLYV